MRYFILSLRVLAALAVLYLAWGLAFGGVESGNAEPAWQGRMVEYVLALVIGFGGGVLGRVVAGVSGLWLVLAGVLLVAVDTLGAYQVLHLPEPLWLDITVRGIALWLVILGIGFCQILIKRSRQSIELLS